MGSTTSKQKESGGVHVFEFHLASATMGIGGVIIMLVVVLVTFAIGLKCIKCCKTRSFKGKRSGLYNHRNSLPMHALPSQPALPFATQSSQFPLSFGPYHMPSPYYAPPMIAYHGRNEFLPENRGVRFDEERFMTLPRCPRVVRPPSAVVQTDEAEIVEVPQESKNRLENEV